MKSTSGPFDGSVVAIQLATGQTSTVLDGFMKPVGVAKLGHKLVVTDARQRAVYIVEMRGGRPLTRVRLTGFDRPDSICACGPDSVLITCYDEGPRRGSVKKLWLDGRTRDRPWPVGAARHRDRWRSRVRVRAAREPDPRVPPLSETTRSDREQRPVQRHRPVEILERDELVSGVRLADVAGADTIASMPCSSYSAASVQKSSEPTFVTNGRTASASASHANGA